MENTAEKTGFVPVCAIEGRHPKMLIKAPRRDKRLDVQTGCDYTENTEAYD